MESFTEGAEGKFALLHKHHGKRSPQVLADLFLLLLSDALSCNCAVLQNIFTGIHAYA